MICKNPYPVSQQDWFMDRSQVFLSGSLFLMSHFAFRRRLTLGFLISWPRCSSIVWTVGLLVIAGCHVIPQTPMGLPALSSLENEHLLVKSDFKIPISNPALRDLDNLREEIASELNLPPQRQPVTVYLFGDESRYSHYLQTRYPLLPRRRAYFVGTRDQLAVYTFWGDRVQEDLRHEYTHGVLHASLMDVPLWLDEGLAEYFEVTTQPTGLNREYASRLITDLAQGWKPDLERLESLEKVDDMRKADYQQAWAWVHFMLHHSEETRGILVDYLYELRTNDKPEPLSKKLRTAIPTADLRFANHAASLSNGIMQASGERDEIHDRRK